MSNDKRIKDKRFEMLYRILLFVLALVLAIIFAYVPSYADEIVRYKDGHFISKVYRVKDNKIQGDLTNIERFGKYADENGYIIDGWWWLPSNSWLPKDATYYTKQVRYSDIAFYYSTETTETPTKAKPPNKKTKTTKKKKTKHKPKVFYVR